MILARVFKDAAGLWQRDRDLWLRVAGFYFFVPALAIMLFAPMLDLRKVEEAAVNEAVFSWFTANAWWLIALTMWQIYACGVVLVLALDSGRPSVSAAIMRATRMLPGLMLAYAGAMLMVMAGASFFLVPGLYLFGRTYLVLPLLVAEPKLGPLGALITAIRRSHGRGWMLFFVPASVFLVQNLASSMLSALGDQLGADLAGSRAHFVFGVVLAAIASVGALAQALLQAAAYRAAGASNGI